jgi:hypothetical protein
LWTKQIFFMKRENSERRVGKAKRAHLLTWSLR